MPANQFTRSMCWACLPLLVLTGWFVLIALMNWQYELKFFQPATISGQPDAWLGLKLFAVSIAFGLGASGFAFLAAQQLSARGRLKAALSILVSLALFLMALAFLALGPAAITMREQMVRVVEVGQAGG